MNRRSFIGTTLFGGFAAALGVKPSTAIAAPARRVIESNPLYVVDLWPEVGPLLNESTRSAFKRTFYNTVVEGVEVGGKIFFPDDDPFKPVPWSLEAHEKRMRDAVPARLRNTESTRVTRLIHYIGFEADTIEDGIPFLAEALERLHARYKIAGALLKPAAIRLVSDHWIVMAYVAFEADVDPAVLHAEGVAYVEGDRPRYVGSKPFDYAAYQRGVIEQHNQRVRSCWEVTRDVVDADGGIVAVPCGGTFVDSEMPWPPAKM